MRYIFPIFPHTWRFWFGSLVMAMLFTGVFLVWLNMVFRRFRSLLELSPPEVLNAAILMSIHQLAFSCLICGLFKQLNLTCFLLSNLILTLCLAFLSSGSIKNILHTSKELKEALQEGMKDIFKDGIPLVLFMGLIIICITVVLFLLILPPDSWDAFSYHLPMAALMMQEGHLGPFIVSYDIINVYPKTGEFFFLIPMLLTRSDFWARLVQLCFTLLAIPGIYGLLRRYRLSRSMAFLFSLLPFFFINTIFQAYREWGGVDNILAAIFLMGISAICPCKTKPLAVFGRISLGFVSAMLCFSIKSNGILYLACYCIMALLYILRCRVWKSKNWLLPVTICFFLLPLWSYQYILNYTYHKNPFFPVKVEILGKTFFEGEYSPSNIMAIQIPEKIQGKDTYHALLRSWYMLQANGEYVSWGRLGGWGILWLFGIYPLTLFAIFVFLIRRNWDILRIAVPLLLLFWFMPSNWWARYVGFIFTLCCILGGCVIHWIGKPGIQRLIIAYLAVLALATGGETVISSVAHEKTIERVKIVRKDLKHYGPMATVETFRKWVGDSPEREALRWCVYNLPPESTLYYYWRDKDIFTYFFFRPDYRNRVYFIKDHKTKKDFFEKINKGNHIFVTITDNIPEFSWLNERSSEYNKVYHDNGIAVFETIR